MNYRFKNNVDVVSFPTGFQEENRGNKGCCDCEELVLADPSDSATWKNDCTGVFATALGDSDTIFISMENSTGTVVANQGITAIFPNDSNALGFIYDWQAILNAFGVGCYTIKINYTISGITGGYTWGVYELRQYSIAAARGTVRIKSNFNTYYQKQQIDFTDSNFTDSVRFNGFFGNTQPKTAINNLIGKSRRIEKATRENLNQYTLKTDPLPISITRQIVSFHLLNEDECFITDHNRSNHDYLLLDKPVSLTEGAEFEYKEGNRLANLSAVFGDRQLLDKNYYKQN